MGAFAQFNGQLWSQTPPGQLQVSPRRRLLTDSQQSGSQTVAVAAGTSARVNVGMFLGSAANPDIITPDAAILIERASAGLNTNDGTNGTTLENFSVVLSLGGGINSPFPIFGLPAVQAVIPTGNGSGGNAALALVVTPNLLLNSYDLSTGFGVNAAGKSGTPFGPMRDENSTGIYPLQINFLFSFRSVGGSNVFITNVMFWYRLIHGLSEA